MESRYETMINKTISELYKILIYKLKLYIPKNLKESHKPGQKMKHSSNITIVYIALVRRWYFLFQYKYYSGEVDDDDGKKLSETKTIRFDQKKTTWHRAFHFHPSFSYVFIIFNTLTRCLHIELFLTVQYQTMANTFSSSSSITSCNENNMKKINV